MIKKLVLIVSVLTLTFILSSCGPSHIPVEWVGVWCSSGEVYVGDYVDLTVEIQPHDATDQGYDLTIDNPSVVDFVGPLQVIAITPGHAWVTIQTFDGGHTDQCEIYVTALP